MQGLGPNSKTKRPGHPQRVAVGAESFFLFCCWCGEKRAPSYPVLCMCILSMHAMHCVPTAKAATGQGVNPLPRPIQHGCSGLWQVLLSSDQRRSQPWNMSLRITTTDQQRPSTCRFLFKFEHLCAMGCAPGSPADRLDVDTAARIRQTTLSYNSN